MIDFQCDDCGYFDSGLVYGSSEDWEKMIICVDGVETTIK